MLHVRDAVHHHFDRNRHLLLYLFGGAPRPLSNDLDIVVGYVRVRINGQLVKRDHSPDHQEDGTRQNKEPVIEGEIDKRTDHVALLVRRILEEQHIFNHLVARLDT